MGQQTQKNSFEISGKVVYVGNPIYYTAKLSKRILVLEVWVENKYRQEVQFDFFNENMGLLGNIREKDWVLVDFRLRGHKTIDKQGKARWFASLEAISCTKQDKQ